MTLRITDDTILDCGHKPSIHGEHTTGYATDRQGKTLCYECCGERDKQEMIKSGRSRSLPLYLNAKGEVINWPGTLRFKITNLTKGNHNIAGSRTDVWFVGPDGYVWHGVQYGEWTEVCHCRRTKQLAA